MMPARGTLRAPRRAAPLTPKPTQVTQPFRGPRAPALVSAPRPPGPRAPPPMASRPLPFVPPRHPSAPWHCPRVMPVQQGPAGRRPKCHEYGGAGQFAETRIGGGARPRARRCGVESLSTHCRVGRGPEPSENAAGCPGTGDGALLPSWGAGEARPSWPHRGGADSPRAHTRARDSTRLVNDSELSRPRQALAIRIAGGGRARKDPSVRRREPTRRARRCRLALGSASWPEFESVPRWRFVYARAGRC